MTDRPEPRMLTARQRDIVRTAQAVLESDGWDAVSMRGIAGKLSIKAPSLYKHLAGRAELCAWLVEDALFEMGDALYEAIDSADDAPVEALLRTYREQALAHPERYRLATGRDFNRADLLPGLEEWAGTPFWLVTREEHRAQALFAMAHGLVTMEMDLRLPEESDLDETWRAGGRALTGR